MLLSHAIEVGEDILNFVEPGDPPEEHQAITILVEAAKLLKRSRANWPCPFVLALPGETPESATEHLLATRIGSP